MEQAFQAAMVELHNVREQLYLVRFDDLRETEQLRKEVQNYLSEIERLDAKVGKLKEKMMDSYLKTLNLEQIQMTVPQRKNPPKPSGSTGLSFFFLLSLFFLLLQLTLSTKGTIVKNLKDLSPPKISTVEPCLVMTWK